KSEPCRMNVAEIRWLPAKAGGRTAPPEGGATYSTLARFSHESEEQWRREAWSLKLHLLEPADSNGLQRARLQFLPEARPTECLKPGARFELYEGRRRVAEGVILD